MTAPLCLQEVSKWYGQVLGLQQVTLTLERGIVGLLGPNGAGKSTLMKLATGLVRPSRGRVLLFGEPAADATSVRRRLGYCPEHEGVYEELTAREFVTAMAELAGLSRSEAPRRAEAALVEMGLEESLDRRLAGFSKGMRQRTKLASALAHDPDLLLLDEPLTGCDPLARNRIVSRIKALALAGKTILISSHVLYEIEALTQEVILLHRGQVLAEGNVYRIRELIDEHPHRVRIECEKPRMLAARLVDRDHIVRVDLEDTGLEVETRAPDRAYDDIPTAALETGIKIRALTSPDDNLQAVFEYLTAKTAARPGKEARP